MLQCVQHQLHPLTSLPSGTRPFPFTDRQWAISDDNSAVVTPGELKPGRTRVRVSPTSKVEQGYLHGFCLSSSQARAKLGERSREKFL